MAGILARRMAPHRRLPSRAGIGPAVPSSTQPRNPMTSNVTRRPLKAAERSGWNARARTMTREEAPSCVNSIRPAKMAGHRIIMADAIRIGRESIHGRDHVVIGRIVGFLG